MNSILQVTAREDDKLFLDIEDGFYYLNAGYEDMLDWNGIYFEYLTTNSYNEPVTYNWCLAASNQLNHINSDTDITYPVYLFTKGVGELHGYYPIINND